MAMKISHFEQGPEHDAVSPLIRGPRRASVTVSSAATDGGSGFGIGRSSRPFRSARPRAAPRSRPARSRDRPRTPPPARATGPHRGSSPVARRDGPSADLSLHEGGEPVRRRPRPPFPAVATGSAARAAAGKASCSDSRAGHAAIGGGTQRLGDVGDLGHGGQRLGEGLGPALRRGRSSLTAASASAAAHGGLRLGLGGGHGLGGFGLGGPRRLPSAARRASSASGGEARGPLPPGRASGLPWRRRASAASAASAVTSPVKTGRSSSVVTRFGQRADRAGGLIDAVRSARRSSIGHRGKIRRYGGSAAPRSATCSCRTASASDCRASAVSISVMVSDVPNPGSRSDMLAK